MADLRKLKDKAAEHFAKGRFARAAEALGQLVSAEPRDIALRQKLGDALRKAGEEGEALRVYRDVADRYAKDGQLLKAVAICKLILDLDPEHAETQEQLAELYARKHGVGMSVKGMAPTPTEQPAEPEEPAVEIQLVPMGGARVIELAPEGEVPELERPAEGVAPAAGAQAPPTREVDFSASELPQELELTIEPEEEAAPTGPSGAPPAPAPPAEQRAPAAGEPAAPTPFEAILGAARERAAAEGAALLLSDPLLGEDEPLAPGGEPPAEGGDEAAEPIAPQPARPPAAAAPLPRIPLFSDLSPAAFVALAEQLTLHRVPAGTAILREGEPGTSFFVIASGEVRVEKTGPGGAPTPLADLGEGSFFGEMAILSGAPRAATVVAAADCDLLEIRADVLLSLAREHPQVVESLGKFYRRRLLANAMATSPVFRPFGRGERAEIMGRFRTREAPVGTAVITEGEPADGLYVVLSGALDVWKQREGEQVLAARLHEGDVFGEMSCLRKGPAGATVMAARRCVLLRLPRSAFDELVVTYPQILELVSELVDERQQTLEAIVAGQARMGDEGLILV